MTLLTLPIDVPSLRSPLPERYQRPPRGAASSIDEPLLREAARVSVWIRLHGVLERLAGLVRLPEPLVC